MSRVINPDSAGKERTRLSKAIVLSIRQIARLQDISDESRDLSAFIVLALKQISKGIDISVAAWEKRDYWVKADRFRMEWAWAGALAEKLRTALLADDWANVAMISAQVAEKLSKVKVSEKHRMGSPWVGAYRQLLDEGKIEN